MTALVEVSGVSIRAPGGRWLFEGLTVLENMRLYARFVGLSKAQAAPRIEELLADMSLEHKRDATIKTLSGGMKRRLTFVRALLADPELLILDEPCAGLDPVARDEFLEMMRGLMRQGDAHWAT